MVVMMRMIILYVTILALMQMAIRSSLFIFFCLFFLIGTYMALQLPHCVSYIWMIFIPVEPPYCISDRSHHSCATRTTSYHRILKHLRLQSTTQACYKIIQVRWIIVNNIINPDLLPEPGNNGVVVIIIIIIIVVVVVVLSLLLLRLLLSSLLLWRHQNPYQLSLNLPGEHFFKHNSRGFRSEATTVLSFLPPECWRFNGALLKMRYCGAIIMANPL